MSAPGASSYLARVAAAGARRFSGVDMPAVPPAAVPAGRGGGRDHLLAGDEPRLDALSGPAEDAPPLEGAAAAPGPVPVARPSPWPSLPKAGPGAGRVNEEEEEVTVIRASRALRSRVPPDPPPPPASTSEPSVETRPAETAASPSPGPLLAPEPAVQSAFTASGPGASRPGGVHAPEPPLPGDAGAVPLDAPAAVPPAVARIPRVVRAPRAPAPGSWARPPDVAVHVEPAPTQRQAPAGARHEPRAKLSIGRIDLLVDNRPPERPAETAAPAAPAAPAAQPQRLDPMTSRFLDRLLLHPR